MTHLPGCGCPGPATGPCPLNPTPADQQAEMSTVDLVHAALAGEIQPDQQTSAGHPVALNDTTALKSAIIAALSGTQQ